MSFLNNNEQNARSIVHDAFSEFSTFLDTKGYHTASVGGKQINGLVTTVKSKLQNGQWLQSDVLSSGMIRIHGSLRIENSDLVTPDLTFRQSEVSVERLRKSLEFWYKNALDLGLIEPPAAN